MCQAALYGGQLISTLNAMIFLSPSLLCNSHSRTTLLASLSQGVMPSLPTSFGEASAPDIRVMCMLYRGHVTLSRSKT